MIVNQVWDEDGLAGAGKFDFEILHDDGSTQLSSYASVTDVVDIAMLPKAIGGTKVSFVDDNGRGDETYSRGVEHPSFLALMGGLTNLG